jgi:hypothetical protein
MSAFECSIRSKSLRSTSHLHAPRGEGAAMSWLLAFIAKWRAARRAAHLIRIQRITRRGLSAID